MANNNRPNRRRAQALAAKGASQETIQQKTGVSSTAAQKFIAKAEAATPTPPPTQATPTSFQVTPSTQTPNITFTPAERAGGNIYGTDIGNGLTAYTQGAPIKDPSVLRQQIGLPATPETAPETMAATSGGGTKTQQNTQNPLRQALKGVGKSLSGKEAMQILKDTGVKQDRLLKTAQKMGLGIQGSLERRVQKGQLATPEERLLANVFDTQRQNMNGGMTGSGIPSVLDPRSQIQKTLASGSVGLQPGQRLTGVTKTGQPILTTKDQLAGQRQAPIAAAPDVGQPAATAPAETEAPTDMTAMDALGGIDSYAPDPLLSLLDEMMAGFTDAMSGYQQNQADMYSSLLESIASAGSPRLYGAGRNYNIDAIRAALASRRPRGRSSYLRGGTTGGSPMGIGAFAPAIAGLSGGGVNI